MRDEDFIGICTEDGEQLTIAQFISRLPMSDNKKSSLCTCLALSVAIGYEIGFKAAMAINTGMDLEDPKLIKLLKDMEPASKFNVAKYVKDLNDVVKAYSEKEEVDKNV